MNVRKVIAGVIEFAVPLALFYGLRAAGAGLYVTLVVSSVIPAVVTIVKLIRQRKIDGLALYLLAIMLLSVLVSLLAGAPRLLLAREGWITGITGAWFLATAWTRQPLAYLYSRPLLERRVGRRDVPWDLLFEQLPAFRRIWRTCTVLWGVGLLVDAALRVLMAYTLPVDIVPALGSGLLIATSLVLLVIVNVVQFRAGMFDPRSRLYAPLREADSRDTETGAEDQYRRAVRGAPVDGAAVGEHAM